MVGMKKFNNVLLVLSSMLFILSLINQLLKPDYWGGILTGHLFGYTLAFWLFSGIINGYNELVYAALNLSEDALKKIDELEARIFFLSKEEKKK